MGRIKETLSQVFLWDQKNGARCPTLTCLICYMLRWLLTRERFKCMVHNNTLRILWTIFLNHISCIAMLCSVLPESRDFGSNQPVQLRFNSVSLIYKLISKRIPAWFSAALIFWVNFEAGNHFILSSKTVLHDKLSFDRRNLKKINFQVLLPLLKNE